MRVGDDRHNWHVAINQHVWPKDGPVKDHDSVKWMYEAKEMHSEVPRLKLLFERERLNLLPKVHRQCSHSEAVPVHENHLSCCLGVKCRECPELKALESMDASPEFISEAKAWTCAAHIVSSGGDVAREGYLLTVDDRMYWDNVYRSMARSLDEPSPRVEMTPFPSAIAEEEQP
jgi:hypothetical protein